MDRPSATIWRAHRSWCSPRRRHLHLDPSMRRDRRLAGRLRRRAATAPGAARGRRAATPHLSRRVRRPERCHIECDHRRPGAPERRDLVPPAALRRRCRRLAEPRPQAERVSGSGGKDLGRVRSIRFASDLRPWLGDPPPAFVRLTSIDGPCCRPIQTTARSSPVSLELVPDRPGSRRSGAGHRRRGHCAGGLRMDCSRPTGRALPAGPGRSRRRCARPSHAGGRNRDQFRHDRRGQPGLEACRDPARLGRSTSARQLCGRA